MRTAASTGTARRKQAGDFVDLRAEIDLVLVLSNCPHPLDPARPAAAAPSPSFGIARRPPRPTIPAARRRPEIVRAFEFTDRLYA